MGIQDRKGALRVPDRVLVWFARVWAKLSSRTSVHWIPLSWVGLPFVFVTQVVGTLYGLRYLSGEMEVFLPFWDSKAGLQGSSSERWRRKTPTPTSLLTLPYSGAERAQPTHLRASPYTNVCSEWVNQSWCDIPPRITWHHRPSPFQGFLAPILLLTRQSRLLPTSKEKAPHCSTNQKSHSCPWALGHMLLGKPGSLELSGETESPIQGSNSTNPCVISKLNWPSCDLKTAHINYLRIGIFYPLWFHYIKHC